MASSLRCVVFIKIVYIVLRLQLVAVVKPKYVALDLLENLGADLLPSGFFVGMPLQQETFDGTFPAFVVRQVTPYFT